MNYQKVSISSVVVILIMMGSGVTSYYYSPNNYEPFVKPGQGWSGWNAPLPQRPYAPVRAMVSFFQNRFCQGSEYAVEIGGGECQVLPRELCDWNLSLKTFGSCIQVFENDSCRDNPSLKWGLRSSKIFQTNQCSSTKLNGFDVIRSFRRCAC